MTYTTTSARATRHKLHWWMPCLLTSCLLLTACGGVRPLPIPQEDGSLADEQTLPQDLQVYAAAAGGNVRIVDAQIQQQQWERYQRLLFGPWRGARVSIKAQDAFAPLKSGGYAENLLPWTTLQMQALIANSNQSAYPSRLDPGITVRATALRAAPTLKPRFDNPAKAGEGYPFDMWQYAMLPLGMPVLMTHTTRDGGWVYIETALVGGWIAAHDVAVVDEAYMTRMQQAQLVAVMQEDVPVAGADRTLAGVGIGTLLAQTGSHAAGMQVLLPGRDANGMVSPLAGTVPHTAVAAVPVPLTPTAVADLGNRIMGQPYGWGGMYANRDCSAMLRDIFAPFGVWLPRNSAAQAKAWSFVDFGKAAPQGKESIIVQQGQPFATLLWLPGHITLYVGVYKGRAVMFHDMWGIRTEQDGKEGRYIVGRALVSSTQPGIELPQIQDKNGLLARMKGMSILK